jgi:uncharacterized membrane protein
MELPPLTRIITAGFYFVGIVAAIYAIYFLVAGITWPSNHLPGEICTVIAAFTLASGFLLSNEVEY